VATTRHRQGVSNQNITVGLIRLPQLAAALSAAGVRVATGDDFRSSARAVVAAAKEGPVVLLVADLAQSGEAPWLEKTLRSATAAMVRVDIDAVSSEPGTARRIAGNTGDVPRVQTPASVAEVLEAVGLPCPRELTEHQILPDGSVANPAETSTGPAPTVSAIPTWPGAHEQPSTDSGWDAPPAITRRAPLTASQPVPSIHQRPAAQVASVAVAEDWETLLEEPAAAGPFHRIAPTSAPAEPAFPTAIADPTVGAPVIIITAGKGGVSKSTTAMTIAQRAARLGHMRVVLIDGNRGQGDLRIFMRLTRSALPTIYDVATGTDPAQIVITPDRLAANRPGDVDRLEFAMVMAPPDGLADPTLVTSEVYSRVLEHARSVADLVVVDTQIQESADTSGLFDDVWTPALSTHGWLLGISDLSTPGVDNLYKRLTELTSLGVPTSRIGVMLNRVSRGLTFNEDKTRELFSRFGRWLGVVHNDDAINAQTNNGELPWDHPEMAHVLDQVLFQITQDSVFTQTRQAPSTPEPKQRSESGLFGFLRRKGN